MNNEIESSLRYAVSFPEGHVTHYVASSGMTVMWPVRQTYDTVLEFNLWKGQEEPDEASLAPRKCVLMECAHDAVLTVAKLIEEGDSVALEALLLATFPPDGTTGVLGYDFVRREPRVLLYFT
jgi:hypothetical protein